jgi:hypothetical protein
VRTAVPVRNSALEACCTDRTRTMAKRHLMTANARVQRAGAEAEAHYR